MGGRCPQLRKLGWLLAAALTVTADTRAQSTAPVTATFVVASQSTLVFSSTALVFPDADPDTVPVIAASGPPVTITAKVRLESGQAALTVLASDDLRGGMDTIAVSAIRWTASGAGFVGGTMSHVLAQPVAAWSASGAYTGTLSFTLANSWDYAVGNYSTTFTYTLSVP